MRIYHPLIENVKKKKLLEQFLYEERTTLKLTRITTKIIYTNIEPSAPILKKPLNTSNRVFINLQYTKINMDKNEIFY